MFQGNMASHLLLRMFILIHLRFSSLRTASAKAKQSEDINMGLRTFWNAAIFFRLKWDGIQKRHVAKK